MQDLSLHIEYLLRYHDCVIVPGIGAFLRSRNAAEIDEATGTLSPAYEFICFNASISTDDGLLAHSVSRKDGISFEQARTEVSDTAEAMRTTLNEDGEIRLGKIGTLRCDENGILSFLPMQRRQLQMLRITPSNIPTPAVVNEEDKAENEAENNEETKKNRAYYTLHIPRRLVRYAAMLALVIVGAMSLSIPAGDMPGQPNRASVVPLPTEKVKQVQEVAPEKQVDTVAAPRYFLIVGASHSDAKCDEFIAQHPDFELKKVKSGASKILIYVDSAAVREELLPTMRSSEVKSEFGQTWIYDSESI